MSNKRGGDMEKASAGKRTTVEMHDCEKQMCTPAPIETESGKRKLAKESATAPEADFVDDGLTPKQIRFVQEFCIDFNQTQSAIRAGYSEHTASAIGHENLSKPSVLAAIRLRMAALAAAADVDATRVISELAAIAFADPRDLMRVQIDSCRHCHGIEHQYQWSEPEYKRELKAALGAGKPAPDIEGGFGFDPRREPHSQCPGCFGRGVSTVIVTDSRKLSRGAARLLASVKQTKDGIEVKTLDQQGALLILARIVGIDKQRSELSGPGGGPLQLQPVPRPDPRTLSNEELEAALKLAGYPLIEGSITS
jgi:phage terminase small subunit